jgi:FkbM family methyltransferase
MEKMIFDIGFHNGTDTKNYLEKGFKVIAVEANEDLCNEGSKMFAQAIEGGRLIILNRAFADHGHGEIPFFVHTNLDWSTADPDKAEYLEIEKTSKMIKTISYHDLIAVFGMPYYIKCDIEGYDYKLIEQICESDRKIKPEYISFELSRLDYFKIFSFLYVAGYRKFQLRNQLYNSPYSSGEFARYLPDEKWVDFDTCLTHYMKYKELKAIDNKNLALGWVDIHARHTSNKR